MSLLLVSIVFNAFVTVVVATGAYMEFDPWIAQLLTVCWSVQVLGTIMLRFKPVRGLGTLLACVGSLGFLPLGLIGIAGARAAAREAHAREVMGSDPV